MNELEKKNDTVEYVPYGASDKIKLNIGIVQNLIAVPTRSGKTCSTKDALKFIGMCQAKRLNPLEGDAFLIGFDSKNGPSFTLVTAHQAYLKRAEIHPQFDGMESGIVIKGEKGEQRLDTEIIPDGAELVGAWAKVHLKERKIPTLKVIPLARFKTLIGRQQEWGGPWRDDPAGMAVKCAECDALRSSFPTMLGGLMMREEITLDVNGSPARDIPAGALVEVVGTPGEDDKAEADAGLAPRPLAPRPALNRGNAERKAANDAATATSSTPSEEVAAILETVSYDDFRDFAKVQFQVDLSDVGSYAEIPKAIAEGILKQPNILLKCRKTFGKTFGKAK